MTDISTAPAGGADAIVSVPVVTPATADSTPITASEAARQLSSYRWKRDNPEAATDTPAEPAKSAEPPQPLAETPTSDQPTADPAETTPEAEPAEPTIEPPRSWTKEEKEEFATYPREAQQKIARREQERETALRRSQNEAAEQRKSIEAERTKAEQVRQDYEAKLPAIMQALQDAQAGTFPDIRTMDDVTRIANEDPFRYLQWQAHQQKLQAVNHEVETAKQRQAHEQKSKWADHVQKENELAAERNPELADPVKAKQLQSAAVELLHDKGFTQGELTKLASGEDKLSIFDHRIQSLLLDGVKYREAKTNVAKPAKPVPPVSQRPGVSKAPSSAADAQIQDLAKRFERTGDPRDGAALLNARRRASA